MDKAYLRAILASMKILVQQACIIDPQSPHHGKVQDILMVDGIFKEIGNSINAKADQVVNHEGLHVSPGWVDVFANFCDPGYEFKETLETGANAAAAGGYTDVFIIPNTRPVIDTKAQVEYVRQKSRTLPVSVWPIGAVTKNLEGKELAEMYDMQNSGAAAFGDGIHPIQSSGLLLKALQYVKAFQGVIIQIPDDKSIGANGLMHEGIVSTQLGLPGKPQMAEELIIARDIKLARYAESSIHFTGITSIKSLEYIKRAKDSGLNITCSVTPYHLFFTDEDLVNYDPNLKVYPPLRPKQTVEALKKALADGTVDCIASHHLPHEYDSKVLEFENAKYGMTGLETSYSIIRMVVPELSQEKLVNLFSTNPRRIFGMNPSTIKIGNPCSISLFDPVKKWTFSDQQIRSKSRNTPFIGKELQGKAMGIINRDEVYLNN
jgi:dihydroorotase